MPNDPAFRGAYVDPNLTVRNPPAQEIDPLIEKSGSTTTGGTTVYEPEGTNHSPDNSSAPAKPHSPNSWRPGRDPYAQNGMVGQDFFKNQ